MSSRSRQKNHPRQAESATAARARESGAKTPQDRAARAEATGGTYTVTIHGITLDVAHETLDDFELLDAATQGAMGPLFREIVGDQQKDVLDAIRGENGRVTHQAIKDFIDAVFEQAGQGNS